jgi:hypothetical protein
VDQEVDGATMTGMLDLRDIFELIGDGLDDGTFAQEEFVGPVEQTIVHLFAQLGNEGQSLRDHQLLSQRHREVAFSAAKLPYEPFGELGNGMPLIDVAWGQAKSQEFALIIDDQVQLAAVKAADRRFTASGSSIKDAIACGCGRGDRQQEEWSR